MGYKTPNTYALKIEHYAVSPLDSTVYYFGSRGARPMETSATYNRVYIPRTGHIRACIYCFMATSDVGTAEDIVVAIRKNDTTDYVFSTVGIADNFRVFSNYTLNIPVTQGDYIEMKVTTPAWVTNPTDVWGYGNLLFECY